jgi:beta-N-acetylhexosaminidase
MTDSLYMKAISQHYTLPQAAVLSVIAGDDLLEGAYNSYSMGAILAALHSAINAGSITTARIDQSVIRILELKARFGLIPMKVPPSVGIYSADLVASMSSPHISSPPFLASGFILLGRESASPW